MCLFSRAVSSDDESKRQPSPPFVIEEYKIQLITEWQEWGPCSVCGQEGERRRVGICFIRKLKDDEEVLNFPYLNNILDFSPSGIPCRSELLKAFQMGVLGLRPDEVERSTCLEPCRSKQCNVSVYLSVVESEKLKEI
ncbi:hypothetical protein CHS0354_028986 [Potamilus streckersoni]|uniref:Uncharacterized protein n=1 Tax=Potamilus streckersoni TaxID=2493646 RepID=A0AAE0T6F8_9BIVA|nr:hypothetical protein CHS0354_028986 [Potamilus streckersoni]